ncbi:tripartite tricarboxylate transporter TctB family protein [Halomonas sp. H2]|uniref:tripartite tricarboxylate transporter TctB family protein n=1 Tax=Halomonas sp. H2 TaxID=261936 RepID=UPI003CEF33A7
MRKPLADVWISLFLLAFCGFAASRTLLLTAKSTGTSAGPTFIPWLMIGAVSLLSIGLLVRALWCSNLAKEVNTLPARSTLILIALFAALLSVYAAAFVAVGYLVSTLIVFVLGMVLLGERRVLVLAILPAMITGIVYLGFTRLLGVWLP